VVNKPAELTLEVQAAGEPVGTLELGVVDPGRHTVSWRLDTDDGPLPPGTYDVQLVAIDEDAERAGAPVQVTIGQTGSGARSRPCWRTSPSRRNDPRPRPSSRSCLPVRQACWVGSCWVGDGRGHERPAPATVAGPSTPAAATAGRPRLRDPPWPEFPPGMRHDAGDPDEAFRVPFTVLDSGLMIVWTLLAQVLVAVRPRSWASWTWGRTWPSSPSTSSA
jgi:hypothetical protein